MGYRQQRGIHYRDKVHPLGDYLCLARWKRTAQTDGISLGRKPDLFSKTCISAERIPLSSSSQLSSASACLAFFMCSSRAHPLEMKQPRIAVALLITLIPKRSHREKVRSHQGKELDENHVSFLQQFAHNLIYIKYTIFISLTLWCVLLH